MSTASALDDRGGTITGGTGTSVDGRRWSGCGARKGKDPPRGEATVASIKLFFELVWVFVLFLFSSPTLFLSCFECLAVTIKVVSLRSPRVCANGRSGCLAVFSVYAMKMTHNCD